MLEIGRNMINPGHWKQMMAGPSVHWALCRKGYSGLNGVQKCCRWAPETLKFRDGVRKPRGSLATMPWQSPTPGQTSATPGSSRATPRPSPLGSPTGEILVPSLANPAAHVSARQADRLAAHEKSMHLDLQCHGMQALHRAMWHFIAPPSKIEAVARVISHS